MDNKFGFWLPVEARRMLVIMGMVFAAVLIFQHFELPYGNILSSLSSADKDVLRGNSSSPLRDGVLSPPELVSNLTRFEDRNGLNSSGLSYGARESVGDDGQERAADRSNAAVSQGNAVFNNSSGKDNSKEFSSEQLRDRSENSTSSPVNSSANESVPEKMEHEFSQGNVTLTSENSGNTSDGEDDGEEESAPEYLVDINSTLNTPNSSMAVLPPKDSSSGIPIPRNVESSITTPVDSKTSSTEGDAKPGLINGGKSGELKNNVTTLHDGSSAVPRVKKIPETPRTPTVKKMPEKQLPEVVTISEMNDMLLQSLSSPHSKRPKWPSAADKDLLYARSQIENAPILKNDPILYAPLYRNVSMFKRSYELMENTLKVYVYKEGERPILHQPLLQGIYASEGWFMKLLEGNRKFVTKDPRKAHLFYLPFGSRNLEVALYVPDSHTHKNLIQYLKNYLDMLVAKYPFWNRTEGADHFLVACHDWAPHETGQLMANCIRALCNADPKQGFIFGKDASLPETNVRIPKRPLSDLGGKPVSQRPILAFFAGSMHGYLRPILLQYWENKDPDMKIFGKLPKVKTRGKKRVKGQISYDEYMKSSKYCICAKGFEVNSPRVVEAIFHECVPVIISDNFVPPFFEVLNWESFAVFVLEKDIPDLKNILLSIPDWRYNEMQMRVKMVQKHFLWHPRPEKYDIFHMILHSVWHNRVFQMQPN